MRIHSQILSILFLLSTAIYSQPYPIAVLGFEQGLSNNYVVDITQDKDGFLWFATEEGLNKFNGTRFTNFYKHTNSISGNELNVILADPVEPIIWIATQRAGLNAYNYHENSLQVFTHRYTSPSSIVTNDVTSIARASDGNLWLSTYHRGIEYFNKETKEFTHFNKSTLTELPSDNVWTIIEDEEDHLYIGHVTHGMSILSLKDKRITNFMHDPANPNSIPGNEVRCIYIDSNNNIWVGTNNGIALFNENTKSFTGLDYFTDSLPASCIFDIYQTDDNKLWVATELNGIFIIDLKKHFFQQPTQLSITHYTVGHNKFSLSNATIRAIFQDSFKNIWLGTYGGGINFIGNAPPVFNAFNYSPITDDVNSMNNRVALSLCMDADDRLWIGTDGGGINIFEKRKRTEVITKAKNKLSHNTIQAILKDSRENMWIGTFQGGVTFYNRQTKEFQSLRLSGKPDLNVRCFFEDNNARIWIGTHSGVYVLDAETRKELNHYNNENSLLPENLVRGIHQDKQNRLWIGTFGQGLAIYTPEMQLVAHFNESTGFCSNTINHIFRDSQGNTWIASGEGLACFPNSDSDSLSYQIFQRKDGLLNTYIRAITEDEKGNIWFSTNAGISCYLTGQKLFRNYNHFDKAPMGSFVNAVTQDKDGRIYFGSIDGVRFFEPAAVLNYRAIPPVIITELKIHEAHPAHLDNLNISYFDNNNKKIKLNYKQSTFSIYFNIQDYALANQVEYAYKLKGIDDAWHTVDENNVTFRNIPPGHYEFKVRACISNQEWSDHINTLFIHITPPFWLSWQAKTCYVMVGALMLFLFLRAYRKKMDFQVSYGLEKKNYEQEQELNNERLRFYTNIAHELRTPLTLILGPLEDLLKDKQLIPRQLQKISVVRQSALRLLNLINQILEFRKTETQNKRLCVSKGNIAAVVKEITLKYKELNIQPEIDFSTSIEKEQMPLYFDKEIVNIILDNLISNAFKSTEKGKIRVSLYASTHNDVDYTEIKVQDTGYGISQEEQTRIFDRYYQTVNRHRTSGTGIGLALVKNLVLLHEGEIHVESKLNEGSSFCFSLLTHNIYPNALHSDEEHTPAKETEKTESTETILPSDKPILLVVEDNADIREYISDAFNDHFDVITANEGEEGYKAAITHVPDIIVSDIMMPGINGIELCKMIKEDIRTSHIPVILLTAKDSLQDKEEGYLSGADSYLTKPFSASLLHSRINNLLEAGRKLAKQYHSNPELSSKSIQFRESLNKLDNEFLHSLTRIVEENLESEKIDITYLSNKLFMSSSTLYRKVKALTGISTNEFVRKIKMRNAEKLLLTGRYTISEITFRVGMSSPVYFRQCFKDEFGTTPSEFLKRIKD